MKYTAPLFGLLGGVLLSIIASFTSNTIQESLKYLGAFLIAASLFFLFMERFVFLEEYEESRLSQKKKEARE